MTNNLQQETAETWLPHSLSEANVRDLKINQNKTKCFISLRNLDDIRKELNIWEYHFQKVYLKYLGTTANGRNNKNIKIQNIQEESISLYQIRSSKIEVVYTHIKERAR